MLKELEDYTWFPAMLRRWQMDFIGNMVIWTKLYQPLQPVMEELIHVNKVRSIQDTCSGSGLPALSLHGKLNAEIPLLLTDKYPPAVFKKNELVEYAVQAADILDLKPAGDTLYTMFNSFHHFSDEQQNEIVRNFSNNRAPFLVAEILEPGIGEGIKIFFTTTIGQLITAPFVQPFSLVRLFFTYILPVNLFTVAWDGIISVIKSKTCKQYNKQLSHISTPSFVISVHQLNNWKGNLVYIKGTPIHT